MLKRLILGFFVLAASAFSAGVVKAQPIAVKTNLLYDATTTPNLGIEVGLGKRNSIQLFYGLNPWEFNKDKPAYERMKAKHWVVMPEFRWWTCSKMNGFFYGVHLMGGQFNAANVTVPQVGYFFAPSSAVAAQEPQKGNIFKAVRDTRVEGAFIGGGVTIGYQWILGRHWNLEAEIGAGYDYVWTDHYRCNECDKLIHSGGVNYIGLTKAGVCLMYVF